MHKPLLADKNKEIMVPDMLAREISWTVTGILSLQYLHQLCLEGRLVGGVELCFCESGEGDYSKMTVLTCLLFPSAGAYGKQVMALLLNLPGQLAHVRRA